MKRFLKYAIAPAVFAVILAALAFNRNDSGVSVLTDADGGTVYEYDYAPPKSYQKIFARDTITGTTQDTVRIPWIMASPFQYEYYVRLRKLSGTPNTRVVLEARTVTNGIWSPVDSVSCSGADSVKVHFRLRGSIVYGSQHQLIFKRTGSHSLQRDIQINIKPPNQ